MYYSGQHRITFDDKYDTWSSWHLVPSERPEVKPPPFKENYLEIGGKSGRLDASTSLTGYPLFDNREGSWEFLIMNEYESYPGWSEVYSDILNKVHGKEMRVRLADDPNYFYKGRVKVNDHASDKVASKITLDYNFEPYKYYGQTVLEQYPEVFGAIPIPADGNKHVLFEDIISRGFVDSMPILPTFKTTFMDPVPEDVATIRFVNSELGIDITQGFRHGERESPRFVITNFSGSNTCFFEMSGNRSFDFELNYRNGRL